LLRKGTRSRKCFSYAHTVDAPVTHTAKNGTPQVSTTTCVLRLTWSWARQSTWPLPMWCLSTPTSWPPPRRTRRSRRCTRRGARSLPTIGAAVVANDVLLDADVVVDNAVRVDADVVAAATYTAKQTRHAPWSALLVLPSLTMRCLSTPTLWLPLRTRRSRRGTRRGARCWCCRR